MITSLVFTNTNSVAITLNDDVYPLHLYEAIVASRTEKRTKTATDGMWPTYPYVEGMEITMEGDILADDSDDYYTKRYALTSCLRYKPAARVRKSGDLNVQFDNATEEYTCEVVLDTLSIPRNGASPAFSPYRVVLYSFTPYYIGVSSGDPYYDE